MPRAVLYFTLRALGPAMPAQLTLTECHSVDSIVRGKKRRPRLLLRRRTVLACGAAWS